MASSDAPKHIDRGRQVYWANPFYKVNVGYMAVTAKEKLIHDSHLPGNFVNFISKYIQAFPSIITNDSNYTVKRVKGRFLVFHMDTSTGILSYVAMPDKSGFIVADYGNPNTISGIDIFDGVFAYDEYFVVMHHAWTDLPYHVSWNSYSYAGVSISSGTIDFTDFANTQIGLVGKYNLYPTILQGNNGEYFVRVFDGVGPYDNFTLSCRLQKRKFSNPEYTLDFDSFPVLLTAWYSGDNLEEWVNYCVDIALPMMQLPMIDEGNLYVTSGFPIPLFTDPDYGLTLPQVVPSFYNTFVFNYDTGVLINSQYDSGTGSLVKANNQLYATNLYATGLYYTHADVFAQNNITITWYSKLKAVKPSGNTLNLIQKRLISDAGNTFSGAFSSIYSLDRYWDYVHSLIPAYH